MSPRRYIVVTPMALGIGLGALSHPGFCSQRAAEYFHTFGRFGLRLVDSSTFGNRVARLGSDFPLNLAQSSLCQIANTKHWSSCRQGCQIGTYSCLMYRLFVFLPDA